MKYDYFDVDYFQNGQTKGTVYNNYLEVARTSAIYREIAQLIFDVFRPVRTLEIGCATGIIVKHMNELGVEAHGIDVSEWAITNREHDNVVLAGAEHLPYPDGHFDFVYSVHAMEHIPTALKESAFAELKRVSGSAIHFHMLPIVGEGPYSGPKEVVDEILHRDPTHSLLHNIGWWRQQFAEIDFNPIRASVSFAHESGNVDLGVSQLFVSNYDVGMDVHDRLRVWNADVVNQIRSNYLAAKKGLHLPTGALSGEHTLTATGEWNDVVFEPESLSVNRASIMSAKVSVPGDTGCSLRFCFVTEEGAEADLWREFPAGTSLFSFQLSDFFPRIGSVDRSPVRRIHFGGVASADTTVSLSVTDDGKLVFSS
ncbi:class I SAM-dependent methyltransferase [Agrobacterium tumefaciens]|uniref:class I SAM-dependent methyltransferase n=1 Tax=Agrobacterium tumefaciens TaxID=358 RepID=UPI00068836CF|nr:class I SAM-dependent methyltransferase [Agrobacterium tumefaciens]